MQMRFLQFSACVLWCATLGLPTSLKADELTSAKTNNNPNTELVVDHGSPRQKTLNQKLRNTIVESVEFKENTLEESMNWIAANYDIQIVYDERSLAEEAIDRHEPEVNLALQNIRLSTLLTLLLAPYDSEYISEDGILMVTTQSVAKSKLETVVYNMSSLEDCGWKDTSLVQVLLYRHIPNAVWTPDDPEKQVSIAQSTLIVTQSQPVQREIYQFLKTLKQAPKQDAKKARKGARRRKKEKQSPNANGRLVPRSRSIWKRWLLWSQ
ncbi:hypothetical protein [Thalassoroseus pseudoceratinae]|uniref:hypothetical protein n=1 Tax=Thalassoroseus pseudoceratinae TaxID=2713176 RepID=UPI001422338B|nr:hypothetical protein [Thalassoroseus pseudoceratinae]